MFSPFSTASASAESGEHEGRLLGATRLPSPRQRPLREHLPSGGGRVRGTILSPASHGEGTRGPWTTEVAVAAGWPVPATERPGTEFDRAAGWGKGAEGWEAARREGM